MTERKHGLLNEEPFDRPEDRWMNREVVVTAGELDTLMSYLCKGHRSWRTFWIRQTGCEDIRNRDPECYTCRVFDAVEKIVPRPGDELRKPSLVRRIAWWFRA